MARSWSPFAAYDPAFAASEYARHMKMLQDVKMLQGARMQKAERMKTMRLGMKKMKKAKTPERKRESQNLFKKSM